jgi:hypothetical protein
MGCGLSGPLYWSAGRAADFSGLSEREVRTHWRTVERPIVETHAVRLRKQCVNDEGPGSSVRQLRTPIPFYAEPSSEGPALATVDGGRVVVKVDKRRQLTFSTSIEPINDYSDRIETVL